MGAAIAILLAISAGCHGSEFTMGFTTTSAAAAGLLPIETEVPPGATVVATEGGSVLIWCRGSGRWDSCYWKWTGMVGDTCVFVGVQGVPDTVVKCEYPISRRDNYCQLKVPVVFAEFENSAWMCSLVQKPTRESKITESGTMNLRLARPGNLRVNATTSTVQVRPGESVYLEAVADSSYPGADIEWTLLHRNTDQAVRLLETSAPDCQPNATLQTCPETTSVLEYRAAADPADDDGSTLKCVSSVRDSFGQRQSREQVFRLRVAETSPTLWRAGSVAGVVVGIILLALLLILMLIFWKRRRKAFSGAGPSQQTEEEGGDWRSPSGLVVRDWPLKAELWAKQGAFDPYESEPDEPLVFAWEGRGRPLSPALSMSSLNYSSTTSSSSSSSTSSPSTYESSSRRGSTTTGSSGDSGVYRLYSVSDNFKAAAKGFGGTPCPAGAAGIESWV